MTARSYSSTVAASQGRPHFRTASKSHPSILDIDASSTSDSDSPPRRPSVASSSSSASSHMGSSHPDKFRSWQFPGSPEPDHGTGLGRIEEEGARGVRFANGDRRTPSPTRPQSHNPTPSMPYAPQPTSPHAKRAAAANAHGGNARRPLSRVTWLVLGYFKRTKLSDVMFGCLFMGCFFTFMGSLCGVGYVPPASAVQAVGRQQPAPPLPVGNVGVRLAEPKEDWALPEPSFEDEEILLPLKAGVEPLNPKDDGPLFDFPKAPKAKKPPTPPPSEEVVVVRFSEEHPAVGEVGEMILEPHDVGKDDLLKGSPEGKWGEAHEGHLHHEEEGNIFAVHEGHSGEHSHGDGEAHAEVVDVGSGGWSEEEERRAVVLGQGVRGAHVLESDFHVQPAALQRDALVEEDEEDEEELVNSEDIKLRAQQLTEQQAASWIKPPPEDEADAQMERDYARRLEEAEAAMDAFSEEDDVDVDAVEERSGRRGLRMRRF